MDRLDSMATLLAVVEQAAFRRRPAQARGVLARVDGVGNVNIFGARDYSMRLWLDPAKVAARGLTAGEVVAALRAVNLPVAAGAINQPPASSPGGF